MLSTAQQRFRLWFGGAQVGLGIGILLFGRWWPPGAFLVGFGIFTSYTWRWAEGKTRTHE